MFSHKEIEFSKIYEPDIQAGLDHPRLNKGNLIHKTDNVSTFTAPYVLTSTEKYILLVEVIAF